MTLKPYQEKIIQQLIAQEGLMAKLYAVFALQFPEYKEFWTKISEEEKKHSQLIDKLSRAEKKGLVFFDEGKTKTYTLSTFIGHLENMVEKAEKGEFDLPKAFIYAQDFESALIEKKVFTYFDSLTEKAEGVLKLLNTETLSHVQRVKEMRDEVVKKALK